MTMLDLATWSQLISSVAVLVTLVYLAIEVKQNTAAIYAQTRQALLTGSQNELFQMMQYPEIVINYLKPGDLEKEVYARLSWWLTALMRAREFSWMQYQGGIIDENQWKTEQGVIEINLSMKRTRHWWEEVGRYYFNPKYVAFVDQLLEGKPDTTELMTKSINWDIQHKE